MAKYPKDWHIATDSFDIDNLTTLFNQVLNEIAETNRLLRLMMSTNKPQSTDDEVPI